MRNILGESESIGAAFLAALVGRTVASDICNGHKVRSRCLLYAV